MKKRMSFNNPLIVIEDIPSIENIDFQPLQPAYLHIQRVWFFVLMPVLALGLGASFYFIERLQYVWLMAAVGLAYLLASVVYWVGETWSFRYSGYALREHDILYQSGWWVRSLRVVPFKRVQHMSISVGMLERRYGLASVHVYTAGSSDFTLHGIKEETAQKIKDFIAQQIKQDTTAPILEEETEEIEEKSEETQTQPEEPKTSNGNENA